jgi:hypothetical protein
MRGGAIPLLAWAALLFVLFLGNWIWDAKTVNAAEAAFAAMVVLAAAGALIITGRRQAVRRGAPEVDPTPQALPHSSLGAVLVALSVGAILFGIAWARFLVEAGAVALVASLCRVGLEVRSERRAVRRSGTGAS